MPRIILFALFTIISYNNLTAQVKALYVNDLKHIIGHYEKEKDLLEFVQDSGYNYLLCYNIHYIHKNIFDITDTATSKPLRDFIVRAKTKYGVNKIAAIGETFKPCQVFQDYNLDHIDQPDARFDIINVEYEFWHPVSNAPGGYYCTTYLEPKGYICDTAGSFEFIMTQLIKLDSMCDEYDWLSSEMYIGKPSDRQSAKIMKTLDRVLVHYYRKSDVYNNGNSIYNYLSYRLTDLTDSVDIAHVMPIFNGKSNFMGPWLESHPESQAYDTWQNGVNGYKQDPGPWKKKMAIDGYVWFKFTSMHDTIKPLPPVLSGKLAFHTYTNYAAGDGQLFIYDFDDESLTNISSTWTMDNPINPHFSPDGKHITFMGWNDGLTDWDIFLWEVDGGMDPINLTHARSNKDEDPKFSPCGAKIVYKERYFDGVFKYRFQEMDLDGNIINTIDPPGDHEVSMPYYTPNGAYIKYARGAGSDSDIRSIKLNGTNDQSQQSLTDVQEYYPTTIDDSRYLFTRWINDTTHIDQIYVGTDTSSVKLRLSDCFDYSDANYLKGNYIVFSSTRPDGAGGYDLYIGEMTTGEVWSMNQYLGGLNTSKEELGASFWLKKELQNNPTIKYIAVDNLGYRPEDDKIAIIRNPISGYDSTESYVPGTDYVVKNKVDSTVVFTSGLTQWKNGEEDTIAGDKVWWFNFSDVNTPGEYFITESGKDTGSVAFDINEIVYEDILKEAVRSFYYQRCGVEKQTPHAHHKWVDVACHLDEEQDLDCRDVANPIPGTSKDLSGGWHDAGDYNKYVNFANNTIHDLLSAYEENPRIWKDNYAIPESGNGIADLLDEIKWELEWLLKMQENDGAVHHKVSVIAWPDESTPPSKETIVRRYAPSTASATISACGAYAHAAIIYKSLPIQSFQSFGDSLQLAAIDAWDWIDSHPGDIPSSYDNAGFLNAAAEDDAYTQDAQITAAAAYLLVLTGETIYRDYFDAHYEDTHLFLWNAVMNYFKDPQINEALLYYSISPKATPSVVTAIKDKYSVAMSNEFSGFAPLLEYNDSTDAYRAYLDEYGWGSNVNKCYGGNDFSNMWVYGIDTMDTPKHKDAALGYIHYLHGTNPLQQLYLSNLYEIGGENSVQEFYHGWFDDSTAYDHAETSLYGPAPGFLVGGPNTSYVSPGPDTIAPPEFQPGQKSYKNWNDGDDNAWEITENQVRYQSAYIKLLSHYIPSLASAAKEHYVSTSGDNGNPGTLQLPWRDIDYACNNADVGAKVYVLEGNFVETVSVGVDSITVVNYLGQPVSIDGTGNTSGALLEITNRKGVTFDGFELKNNIFNDAQGILITGKCEDITIRNCKIRDIHFDSDPGAPVNSGTNAQALIVYGDDIVSMVRVQIEHNEIFDCRTGFSEGLAINGNVDTFEVKDNSVHDITNIGIDIIGHEGTCSDPSLDQARNGRVYENTCYKCSSDYAASAGIYVDGGKDIDIDRNTCYQNIWGIEIGCENTGKTSSNINIRNNVIFRNAKAGIALGGFDFPSGSGKVIDCQVYNNTLFDNDTLNGYEAELSISYAENCRFTNNIIYSKNTDNLIVIQYSDTAPIGCELDSNIYYHTSGIDDVEFEWQNSSYTGFAAWKSGTGHDDHTLFDNPSFVNDGIFPPDLHLSSGSVAIEAGTDNGLMMDRDSVWRPLLMKYDKGAYEYGHHWIGKVSHDWHTMGNWSGMHIPISTDQVTIPIPTFYGFYPKVNSDAQVKKLYLGKGSKIEVGSGALFEIGD